MSNTWNGVQTQTWLFFKYFRSVSNWQVVLKKFSPQNKKKGKNHYKDAAVLQGQSLRTTTTTAMFKICVLSRQFSAFHFCMFYKNGFLQNLSKNGATKKAAF